MVKRRKMFVCALLFWRGGFWNAIRIYSYTLLCLMHSFTSSSMYIAIPYLLHNAPKQMHWNCVTSMDAFFFVFTRTYAIPIIDWQISRKHVQFPRYSSHMGCNILQMRLNIDLYCIAILFADGKIAAIFRCFSSLEANAFILWLWH